jgi:hypothetical protein
MWGILGGALFARKEFVAEAYGIEDVSSVMDGAFFGGGTRLGAHLIAIIVVATWSMFWTLLSFGSLWLLDRNHGEDARFLEKSGKTQKLEFGRADANLPTTTGFINPDITEMMNWAVQDDTKDQVSPEKKSTNTSPTPLSRNQSKTKNMEKP